MPNAETRGPLGRPQHRGAPRPRRHRRLPRRRRRARARLAAGPRRGLRVAGRHGRRRNRHATLGDAPPGLDPGGVPLGDGLQLPGHPARGRRGAEPDRRQHVLPARGRDGGRRVRLRPRPRRQDAAGLRGDRPVDPRPLRLPGHDRAHGARGPREPPGARGAHDLALLPLALLVGGALEGRHDRPRRVRRRPRERADLRDADAAVGRRPRRRRRPARAARGPAPGGSDHRRASG